MDVEGFASERVAASNGRRPDSTYDRGVEPEPLTPLPPASRYPRFYGVHCREKGVLLGSTEALRAFSAAECVTAS